MSEQDKLPPNRGNFAYGEDPSLTNLAIEDIKATIKAKYLRVKRPLPSPEQIATMARIAHTRSIRSGPTDHLG